MNTHVRLLGVAAAAALAVTGCATTASGSAGMGSSGYGSYGGSTANCMDCGTVIRIEQMGGTSSGATGAVIGGLVGAAAGRELADDRSTGRRNTATVAGAAAGAVAGNAIQRSMSAAAYNVHVRMNDGRTVVVTQNDLGGIREGAYVRVYNGRAWVR
ncbi:MAG TPA: glycine zipper 2TM domain-containing protein [Lysobacter sp.]